jgi:penicillin G amidase
VSHAVTDTDPELSELEIGVGYGSWVYRSRATSCWRSPDGATSVRSVATAPIGSEPMSDPIRAMAAATLFPSEGELTADGLDDAVTVERDAWGVPRITAASTSDLWFAQGFVTAGERLFQLELQLRLATGRLSEVFGELTYDDDAFMRTIGLDRAGARHAAMWTDEDHAMHRRFRDGVRAWIEQMPAKPVEHQLLEVDPDIPEDPATYASAIALLAWSLSNNWEQELLRAQLDERIGRPMTDLLMPPSTASPAGSNNWAVAGSRTATGAPLLAGDPHLLVTQPGIWLELHLRAPGYEARGVALPFLPGIVLGATPHHAWTATNVTGDVQDLFEEQLNDDGTAARVGDVWEPLTVHEERILVRGEPEPRTLVVRESRHGPILTHGTAGRARTAYRPLDRTYALRWVGYEATLTPSAVVAAAAAADFDAFRRAVLLIDCPGQNFVYADVDGTIGYQCTGRYPVRPIGDGTRPVPGWHDDHEWTGWIAPDDLPFERDPDQGWLVTANDDVQPPGYAHLIGADFHGPNRRDRISALLRRREDHDVASMQAIQRDTLSLAAERLLPTLRKVEPATDRQRDALDRLASWDGDLRADSRQAAIYELWVTAIGRRLLGDRLGDDLLTAYEDFRETFVARALPAILANADVGADVLRAALDDALDEADGRGWGEIHTLALAHPLARIPGLEAIFVAAAIPFGGDQDTICMGAFDVALAHRPAVVSSVRAVWDLGDLERSVSVVPSGTSGNPASPHWADQAPLFANGDAKPSGFETQAVAGLTVRPVASGRHA